jgi:hypothetical protein
MYADSFKFGIVEVYDRIPKYLLHFKEQKYLNLFDYNKTYNQTNTIYNDTSIVYLNMEELFDVINYKDEKDEEIVGIQSVALPLLINKIKSNPQDFLNIMLNKYKIKYEPNRHTIMDYSANTLLEALSKKINNKVIIHYE